MNKQIISFSVALLLSTLNVLANSNCEELYSCGSIGITWDMEIPYAGKLDNWCKIASSQLGLITENDLKISVHTLKYGTEIDEDKRYVTYYGSNGCFNIKFDYPGVYKVMIGDEYSLIRVKTVDLLRR